MFLAGNPSQLRYFFLSTPWSAMLQVCSTLQGINMRLVIFDWKHAPLPKGILAESVLDMCTEPLGKPPMRQDSQGLRFVFAEDNEGLSSNEMSTDVFSG